MPRKPGTSRWSYSSNRVTYASSGVGGLWWYRYTPKLRGTYVADGRVRMVFRDFAFIGQESQDAAIAARRHYGQATCRRHGQERNPVRRGFSASRENTETTARCLDRDNRQGHVVAVLVRIGDHHRHILTDAN